MPESASPTATPQEPDSSPPSPSLPRRRGTSAQLVAPSPLSPPPTPLSPVPTDSPGAEPASPRWSESAPSGRPAANASTRPDSPSEPSLGKELKAELQDLTESGVDALSHGVHYLLTAGRPLQQAAGVWKATEAQAEDIATPAVELMAGYIPEQLLKKAVVHAIKLGLAVSKYVTHHLAFAREVDPNRGRARVEQTGEAPA